MDVFTHCIIKLHLEMISLGHNISYIPNMLVFFEWSAATNNSSECNTPELCIKFLCVILFKVLPMFLTQRFFVNTKIHGPNLLVPTKDHWEILHNDLLILRWIQSIVLFFIHEH